MLQAGQILALGDRLWHISRLREAARGARGLEMQLMGVSPGTEGMGRKALGFVYGQELILQLGPGVRYWRARARDWLETDRGPALRCEPASPLEVLAVHTRHPAAGTLEHEFSWSHSRAELHQTCPRAYYYTYYGAWEGWRSDVPAAVRRTYLLKNLTDRSRWRGTLVHEAIKYVIARLRAADPVSEAEVVAQMRRRARADVEDSQQGRYRERPNRIVGFQEHYYRQPLDWEAAVDVAEQRLHTFFQGRLYGHLQQLPPSAFLNVEELASFEVGGTKVWVQIDLATQEAGTVRLYEWKSGAPDLEAARRQLGVYGLYARQTWSLAGARLIGVVYDLAANARHEFELDAAALSQAEAHIRSSVETLQERLLAADPQQNLADIGNFPQIDELSICHECQFRELCGRAERP